MNPEAKVQSHEEENKGINDDLIRFTFDKILQSGLGKVDHILVGFFTEDCPLSKGEIYKALIPQPEKYSQLIVQYSRHFSEYISPQDLETIQECIGDHPLFGESSRRIIPGKLN